MNLLSPDFLAWLHAHPSSRIFAAVSGGGDSVAMLHALMHHSASQQHPISVVHVHHHWCSEADAWADFVRELAESYHLPFVLHHLSGMIPRGESAEAYARQQRYQYFAELLDEHSLLITAHHQRDQAETLLLQLARSAGSRGLAAMPECKPLGRGLHWRPMLHTDFSTISGYLREHHYDFVHDLSNDDCAHTRNFIRHQVLATWRKHCPQIDRQIAQSARYLAEEQRVLQRLLDAQCDDQEHGQEFHLNADTLNDTLLFTALLRHWLAKNHLGAPPARQLREIIRQIQSSPYALFDLSAARLEKYRNRLYLHPRTAIAAQPQSRDGRVWHWQGVGSIELDASEEVLNNEALTWKLAASKERFHPAWREHAHDLKHLWQERGISPEQRRRSPALYRDGELIWVARLGSKQGSLLRLHWQPATLF